MKFRYKYKIASIKVYDGDTITVNIDLGFGIWLRKQKIRLYGINAPEVRGKEKQKGIEARDALSGKLCFNLDANNIYLETIKDKKGKYGRWLGIIWINNVNINKWMVKNGYAVERIY